MVPILRIRGLTKSYGGFPAVRHVDLDVPEGGFVTLLGPSGCGKTTLLRMIGGFETASSGTIELDGHEIGGLAPEKRPINTVFQSYALFPHMNVRDNLGFSLSLRKRAPTETAERVADALHTVHMDGYQERYPNELSGGQQQRIAVARAIVAGPRLLLLDEPLSALDRKMREHMQVELKDLQRQLGITFLYVTHDQEEAFALSDRIVVMHGGSIVQNAPPKEIYERPATRFVADFIGGAAIVEGRVSGMVGTLAVFETPFGCVRAPAAPGIEPACRAILAIRPENVLIDPERGAYTGWKVMHSLYHGGRYLTEVERDGVRLKGWSQDEFALSSPVRIDIAGERCWISYD